jgi:hypothetical protein
LQLDPGAAEDELTTGGATEEELTIIAVEEEELEGEEGETREEELTPGAGFELDKPPPGELTPGAKLLEDMLEGGSGHSSSSSQEFSGGTNS